MSFSFKRFIVLAITIVMTFFMMVDCEYEDGANVEVEMHNNDVVIGKVEKETVKVTEHVKAETEEVTEAPTEKPIEKQTEPVVKPTEPKKEEFKPVFYLSSYERQVVECIVMGEAGAESYKGQVLVAQCILNACLKDGIQPSRVRTKYQYSGLNSNPSDSVKEAVSAVFDNGYKVTNEPILYFYAPKYCNSSWHESQRFVIEVGGHRFFAER